MVKRNRVLCVIALLAVILFTASCLGMPVLDFTNATPGSPGDFAFVSNRDGEMLEIYLMSLDGTNLQLLPSSEFNKFSVGYSNDLEKFSFIDASDIEGSASEGRPVGVESVLKTVNRSDGVINSLLVNDEFYINNLSGDGTKIVYQLVDMDNEISSIFGINYDGTNNHFIFGTAEEGAFYPNISNDGTLVAYTLVNFEVPVEKTRQLEDGIYTAQWGGEGTPELMVADTETQANIFPAFSPDGTKLAYVTVDYDLEAYVLKEMDINPIDSGSPVVKDTHTLYQSEDFISDLRYSADGSRLLFTNMPSLFNNYDAAGKGGIREMLKSSAKTVKNGDGIHIFSIDAVNGGDLRQLTEGDTWNFFNFLMFAG